MGKKILLNRMKRNPFFMVGGILAIVIVILCFTSPLFVQFDAEANTRKYAFKNALIPVVTLVGLQVAGFLAGTVIVETVYAWPGIGHLITQAVSNRDYALVQSLLLISATVFTIINLIVDIINSFIDPRIILE